MKNSNHQKARLLKQRHDRQAVSSPVVRTGRHTPRELEATLARYRQNGIRPDGFVFTTCGAVSVGAATFAVAVCDTTPTK